MRPQVSLSHKAKSNNAHSNPASDRLQINETNKQLTTKELHDLHRAYAFLENSNQKRAITAACRRTQASEEN